jgi:hypothetical protein
MFVTDIDLRDSARINESVAIRSSPTVFYVGSVTDILVYSRVVANATMLAWAATTLVHINVTVSTREHRALVVVMVRKRPFTNAVGVTWSAKASVIVCCDVCHSDSAGFLTVCTMEARRAHALIDVQGTVASIVARSCNSFALVTVFP